MSERSAQNSSRHRWVVFVCGAVCIAAVGVSAHFVGLEKKETDRRVAAEGRLKTVVSELRLLEEKNRELAEQLREAKKLAEELAREREKVVAAATETTPLPEPSPTQPVVEEAPTGTSEGTPAAPRESVTPSAVTFVSGIPLTKLATVAGKVKDAAGAGWQGFREMIAASLNPGPREAKVVSGSDEPTPKPEPSNASEANQGGATFELSRAMAEAGRSAREAFGQIRGMFSVRSVPPLVTASAQVPPPATAPVQAPSAPESTTKLTATNEELRAELEEVRKEKRELEKEIAERTGKIEGAVNVGQVNITTGRRFSGKVLAVNPKHNFVVIDIGKNQGLEKDTVLIVHRGNKFVGKAQVIKVYEKMAAADLVMDWMQDQVQVNDGVKKF